ncbi:hypothetical protein B0H67DRAFT_575273 [Lasiosphaeris hirsuta]|uniref:Uncharacterized protein n=1 Tax=Lasiosphaeris hirsuta TaxID=260670 RepID=A0AA40DXM4_9PEZI|nr:hypothetical protein B0H67DRAFT_575273 [Lasiosphaeris hirsuta]
MELRSFEPAGYHGSPGNNPPLDLQARSPRHPTEPHTPASAYHRPENHGRRDRYLLAAARPVYLGSAVLSAGASAWCATSLDFGSLLAARVVQGIAVSAVEALPSECDDYRDLFLA